jgi:uncharacterized coiled-coil protein SlyX
MNEAVMRRLEDAIHEQHPQGGMPKPPNPAQDDYSTRRRRTDQCGDGDPLQSLANIISHDPDADLARMPTDKYMAEANYFISQWAARLKRLDDIIATQQQTIDTYKAGMAAGNKTLAEAQARIEAQALVIRELETDVQAARDREARALEQCGMLKGVLLTHGNSVRDIVTQLAGGAEAAGAEQAKGETGS